FSVSNSPYTITYNYSGDSTYVGSTDSSTTLTVTPAPLTITANNKSRTYGTANPTFDATYTGFVNGQGPSALTGTLSCITTATASSSAGSYPITCSGQSSTNYAITYAPGTLTISGAALTITASSNSMTYGGTVPTITASYSGFVNGDSSSSLTTQPVCSTTATKSSPVGAYSSTCSGAVDSNYTINYVNGSVTVNAAVVTVTANNSSRAYGAANPTFTASYSGFVNGDTAAVLSGSPSLTTLATASSPAGSYTITAAQGTLSATNYTFAFVNGTLTVNGAALTVTASSGTMTYGGTA